MFRDATSGTINGLPPEIAKRVVEIQTGLATEATERTEFARREADSLWLKARSWINGSGALDYSWLEELFWRNLSGPGSPADRERTRKGLARAGFYGRRAAWSLWLTETAIGARLLIGVRKAARLVREWVPARPWAGP